MCISRLLKFFVKGSAEDFLKAIGFLGFFVGLLLLATGVAVLLRQALGFEVWGLLVLAGLGLMLKPLSRIPFSALLGLMAGLGCVVLLYWYLPLPDTVLGFSSMWIYLVVFLVPALMVFLVFKFVEDLARLFGIILGSWPVLTVLGFLCLAQGILILLGQSIFSVFG